MNFVVQSDTQDPGGKHTIVLTAANGDVITIATLATEVPYIVGTTVIISVGLP